MVVLLNIGVKCSCFRAKAAHISRHLPSGLWNNISGWFTGIVKDATQWGTNIIQGFIDGINNMAGKAGQAASDVVKNVAKFLGFHSPAKAGPGKDADQWGPNLVNMFANDIKKHSPASEKAAEGMMSGVLNAIQKYQVMILGAEQSHNTKMAAQYKLDESHLKQQLQLYEEITKQGGFTYNLNNLANPIDFAKKVAAKKKAATSGTTGVLNAPGGSTSVSTGGSSSSASNPTYQINNYNNSTTLHIDKIEVPVGTNQQQVRAIVDQVEKELGKRQRMQGIIAQASGVAA